MFIRFVELFCFLSPGDCLEKQRRLICSSYVAQIFAGESEVRTRTVAAVVDSDLCFLTKDEIWMLASQYPELRARLNRFATVGKKLLTKKNMSQTEFDTIKLCGSKHDALSLLSTHPEILHVCCSCAM